MITDEVCKAIFATDEVGTMLFTPQLQINSGEGFQARWVEE